MITLTLTTQQLTDLSYAVNHLIGRYFEPKAEQRTPYIEKDEVTRMLALGQSLQQLMLQELYK